MTYSFKTCVSSQHIWTTHLLSEEVKYIDLGQPKSVAAVPVCSEPDQANKG